MILQNLVKPIEGMSDEELKARLIDLRRRREVDHPKKTKAIKKAAHTQSKKKVTEAEKLLTSLPPDLLSALIKEMESKQ